MLGLGFGFWLVIVLECTLGLGCVRVWVRFRLPVMVRFMVQVSVRVRVPFSVWVRVIFIVSVQVG